MAYIDWASKPLHDAATIAASVSTLGFAVALLTGSSVFDEEFVQIGFCVKNRNVPHRSSFDACFYVDTVLSIFCLYLYSRNKHNKSMSEANKGLLGVVPATLMHGLAHLISGPWYGDADLLPDSIGEFMKSSAWFIQWGMVAFLFGFWCIMLQVTRKFDMNKTHMLVAAVLGTILQIFVPLTIMFPFVQTLIMSNGTLGQWRLYTGLPSVSLFIHLPIALASWSEGFFCETFVKDWLYGHLIYDSTIVLSFLFWYALTWHQYGRGEIKTE